MRLNRGTVVLVVVLAVVFVAAVLINNQQSSAPTPTPTAQEATGPLLPNISGETIVRYEVRDNTDGHFVALTKDTGGAWHIDATNALEGRDPDQSLINTTVGQITSLQYNNVFQDDQLATFGLDHPSYTVLVTTSANQLYTVHIGSKSSTSARYYAVVSQGEAPAEATPEATAEATSNVSSKRIAPVAQEATAEVTPEATAEATTEATAEMTAEATSEVTPMPTANVIHNAQVTLEGQQTIYLIPQTVIDTLKNWLNTPPYAPLPTAIPTGQGTEQLLPIPEIGATAAPPEATVEATAAPTTAPTAAPTTEATAEATAAS